MILIQSRNEPVSRDADKNKLPKLEGFSQQFLVTNV
jgi:hypothetical protein